MSDSFVEQWIQLPPFKQLCGCIVKTRAYPYNDSDVDIEIIYCSYHARSTPVGLATPDDFKKELAASMKTFKENAMAAGKVETPVDKPDYFQEAIEKISAIHHSKKQDYSKRTDIFSNFTLAADLAGVDVSVIFDTLLGIKQARLLNLRDKNPVNESVEDTLLDRAVYSVIAYAYYLSRKESNKLYTLDKAVEEAGRHYDLEGMQNDPRYIKKG